MASLTGCCGTDTACRRIYTFLGDIAPRSRPTLGVSRAERYVGKGNVSAPGH
jgi:hypothetical protein